MAKTKKLDPNFTFHAGDKSFELFMSFGLLNQLSRFFEDISQLDDIYTNPDVKASILFECLSTRDNKGAIIEEFNLMTLECTNEDLDPLLTWVEEHLSDFFIRALALASQAIQRRTQEIKAKKSVKSTEVGTMD